MAYRVFRRPHWSWLIVVTALAAGCGSAQKSSESARTLKEDREAGANILTELTALEEELERQRALDAALLAPEPFVEAEKSIRSARAVEQIGRASCREGVEISVVGVA